MTNDEIRNKVTIWMSELFDDNVKPDKVNLAIEQAVNKITVLKMRNEVIDEKKLLDVFKNIKSKL